MKVLAMTREDILNIIKDIVEEEGGEILNEEQTVAATGLDSFGITMLFLELDNSFSVYNNKEEFHKLNFEYITVKDILDEVETNGTY